VTELHGPRTLLFGVAVGALDKDKAGMGGNLPVKVCLDFAVIARRV